MKTFEENWTAWIDDQLTGRELEEFLASLPDRAAADAEKQSAKKLGSFLRKQAVALSNCGSVWIARALRHDLTATRCRLVGGRFDACFGVASRRLRFLRFARCWSFVKGRRPVSPSI
jgi:hypothetical protein